MTIYNLGTDSGSGIHTLNVFFVSNLQTEKSRNNNIQTDARD